MRLKAGGQVPSALDVPEFSEEQALQLSREYAAKYEADFIRNPDFNFEKYKNEQAQGPGEEVNVLSAMPDQDPNNWDDAYWDRLRQIDFKSSAVSFMDNHASSLGWQAGQQFPLALWDESTSEAPAKKPKVEETPETQQQGETSAQPSLPMPTSTAPKVVFYGDYLWPAEAKRQGGFLTPADSLALSRNPPITAYTLRTHLNRNSLKLHPETFFTSAHETFGAAAKEAADKAAKLGGQFDPVVYMVHATPNMFKVGKEVVVAGGITWPQVMAWTQVPRDYSLPEEAVTRKQELHEHFEKAYKARPVHLLEKNPDYDAKFDQYTATAEEQPQLLGSRRPMGELLKFMKEHGAAVGFQEGFPLFKPPKVITGQASAAGKDVEPAPHEEGVVEEVWNFIKGHAVAIALLPAVAALNLIPGLGEIADAAEFAALSTEAVESTGLVLEGTSAIEGGTVAVEDGTVAVEDGTVAVEDGTVAVGEGTSAVGEGSSAVEDTATAKDVTTGNQGADIAQPEEELNLPDVPTHEPGASVEEQLDNLPDVPTHEIEFSEKVPSDKIAVQAD
ncbi:hypothetical protein MAC_08793 [Metarhizium acridum CQMa 102]|uniref:Uncharacterized protein n=1 Tax=Metarhizium acridum (strain CQMa 102) TaxID=655827 RepID=E9EFZ5_METAQ|nr:uncharacterized protein MAC_08793 [Metarhizium acridum CQMa 102]EFY85175.1 hypothetical protein MAC_08793 [Metarhizium acridum CQMa 102]